ncbi:hypothetical protein WJX84_007006 [Apatococcus fuscideae]|uniref:Uncharacterized protein n=1 Tax=Apatococcus fuscideae TaxID=2026836 RepID=A0AAW1SQL1_9CHLO
MYCGFPGEPFEEYGLLMQDKAEADVSKAEAAPAEPVPEAAQKAGNKAAVDASEEVYKKLEADFRAQLGMPAISSGPAGVQARG